MGTRHTKHSTRNDKIVSHKKRNGKGHAIFCWMLLKEFFPIDLVYVIVRALYVNRRFREDYKVKTTFGKQGNGDGEFSYPTGVAVSPRGEIVVADRANHRIQVFDSKGNFLRKFGSHGSGPGEFGDPRGIRVDEAGNYLIADSSNNRIQICDPFGKSLSIFGTTDLSNPNDVCIGEDQNYYVSDYYGIRLQVFDASGKFLKTIKTKSSPIGVATYQGTIFCGNEVFNQDGELVRTHGEVTSTQYVVVDDDGKIAYSSWSKGLYFFDSEGKALGAHALGSHEGSCGVALGVDGTLVLIECYKHRVHILE